MSKKYIVIDLFSGCGGFSQGFLKENFEILAANEFWRPAAETYKFNHKSTILIEEDIRLPETKEKLYTIVKNKKVNVIIGGPPCQGYSVAGNRNPDDPRGKLYNDFIEIIDNIKPDFFVMENVKGLTSMKHLNPLLENHELDEFKLNCQNLQRYKDLKRFKAQRKLEKDEEKEFKNLSKNVDIIKKNIKSKLIPLIDIIINKFKQINYKVIWDVLNSVDYGVPQFRERVIFIGTKHKNIKLKFPQKTHFQDINQKSITDFITNPKNFKKKWITSKSVLKFYENLEENKEINHIFTKHSKEFIEKLKNVQIGENLYENYSDAWWRLDPDKPARTVKENHGGVFIHYKFNRVLTPRELAALQSFDDTFIFKGTKSSILK
ncbi:MAG: DNA cytosine methyltransferase, partial [Promethearchaeota archaeon]